MEKSNIDVEDRENVLKKEFSQERNSLQKSLDIATSLVQAKSNDVQMCRDQISCLKSELMVKQTLQDRIQLLENKNKELQAQHSISADKPGGDQTDFLNKVIVDQQSKIEVLNRKIKELEEMMLNGEVESSENEKSPRILAPRLFCDICDVFDQHDTEDCPIQSMGYSEVDHGAGQRYDRGHVRPYCDNCEEFGHTTEDCTVEEMY